MFRNFSGRKQTLPGRMIRHTEDHEEDVTASSPAGSDDLLLAREGFFGVEPVPLSRRIRCSKFTLRFQGEDAEQIESSFRAHWYRLHLKQARIAGFTIILFYILFGFFNSFAQVPGNRQIPLLLVRFGVIAIMIAVVIVTFSRRFHRLMQSVLAAEALVAGFGMLALNTLYGEQTGDTIVMALTAFILYTFFIAGMLFPYAFWSAQVVLASWTVFTVSSDDGAYVRSALFFLAQDVIAAISSYRMEKGIRMEFLMSTERESTLAALYYTRSQLEVERQKAERVLANVLPAPICKMVKEDMSHVQIADKVDDASILFADIVGFTAASERLAPSELVGTLNRVFSHFDMLLEQYSLEKIKTIGDCYMVAGNVPLSSSSHLSDMARLSLDMQRCVANFVFHDGTPIAVRIGLHCGPCIAGVIGTKKYMFDIWGDTVNTAARMQTTAESGKIQVTEHVYEHLRSSFVFENRGSIGVTGKGQMTTYFLQHATDEYPDSELLPGVLVSSRHLRFDTTSAASPPASPSESSTFASSPLVALTAVDDDDADPSVTPRTPPVDFTVLEAPTFCIYRLRNPEDVFPDIMAYMLSSLGDNLMTTFAVKPAVLRRFVRAALAAYRHNPFHNMYHAMDVTHALFLFLRMTAGTWRHVLTDLDVFALLVAGLCHDLDHPGTTNAYQVAVMSPLAVLYNDQSCLENHHAARAWTLLSGPDSILSALDPAQRRSFRTTLTGAILATDMAHHGRLMKKFRKRLMPLAGDGNVRGSSTSARAQTAGPVTKHLACALMIKCADLCNMVRSFENAAHWASVLQSELYQQGALERQMNIPVTPNCDAANPPNRAKSQIFFLSTFGLPLYEVLAQCEENCAVFLTNLRTNISLWESLAEAKTELI